MPSPTVVKQKLDELDANIVRLQFSDIDGVLKSVSIPVDQVEKAFDEGIWFDGSSIEGFVRIQESDMRLEPDPRTFSVLPFETPKTARMICDVSHPDGGSFYGDPRFLLKRTLTRAREMGYDFMAGPEPEFFIFKTNDAGDATSDPHDTGGYFDLAPRDQAVRLRARIAETLGEMGYDVEADHHEVAEGQHEIDFKYADALRTADNIATFRMVVRAVSAASDLHASFMPKPVAGINGSGMHTHMSLFEDGENAFYDSEKDFDLSQTARYFLGGLIEHAPAITAVTNPIVNSYKRLVPGYEAPIYVAWSDVNRSALIRKPASDNPEGTRLEYRSPDPSCNPYLYLAVCLRAGLDGIEQEIEAPEPIRENIYDFSETKREEAGIDSLPGNLKESIEALRKDEIILDALGPHVSERFVTSRTAEWRNYKASVSEWELERYLELF